MHDQPASSGFLSFASSGLRPRWTRPWKQVGRACGRRPQVLRTSLRVRTLGRARHVGKLHDASPIHRQPDRVAVRSSCWTHSASSAADVRCWTHLTRHVLHYITRHVLHYITRHVSLVHDYRIVLIIHNASCINYALRVMYLIYMTRYVLVIHYASCTVYTWRYSFGT